VLGKSKLDGKQERSRPCWRCGSPRPPSPKSPAWTARHSTILCVHGTYAEVIQHALWAGGALFFVPLLREPLERGSLPAHRVAQMPPPPSEDGRVSREADGVALPSCRGSLLSTSRSCSSAPDLVFIEALARLTRHKGLEGTVRASSTSSSPAARSPMRGRTGDVDAAPDRRLTPPSGGCDVIHDMRRGPLCSSHRCCSHGAAQPLRSHDLLCAPIGMMHPRASRGPRAEALGAGVSVCGGHRQ